MSIRTQNLITLVAAAEVVRWRMVCAQVAELCERVSLLTKHHHNMVYVVSLMPLVERGCYLRCVLSYVFLTQLIESPPDIGSFLEIKVSAVK